MRAANTPLAPSVLNVGMPAALRIVLALVWMCARPAAVFAETPVPPSASASPRAPSPATVAAWQSGPSHGSDALSRQLRQVEQERASYTTFWPWALISLGSAVVLAGVVKGLGETFACGPKCPTHPSTGMLLLGGIAVSTGGFVWLQLRHRTQRNLDSRIYRLRWDIEGQRYGPGAPGPTAGLPLLHARF